MQNKKYSIEEIIELSLIDGDSVEVLCDVKLEVNGKEYVADHVSICHRDLMFFTEHGTITCLVDSYGDRHSFEIFDYDLDA